jgi:hypothetical protein
MGQFATVPKWKIKKNQWVGTREIPLFNVLPNLLRLPIVILHRSVDKKCFFRIFFDVTNRQDKAKPAVRQGRKTTDLSREPGCF